MSLDTSLPLLLAALLALAVVIAWVRLTRWRRAAADRHGTSLRFAMLCALQPVFAVLLFSV